MKKSILFVLIILILSGCTNNTNTDLPNSTEAKTINQQESSTNISDTTVNQDSKSDNDSGSYFGQYQISDEGFSAIVKDNLIDKDYEKESEELQDSTDFSTQTWVELDDKYIKIWDKELNNIYNLLLRKLNEVEKKKMIESQRGWLQFHTNETEFVNETWDDFGLGSQGRVQLDMAILSRERERTLQLMEYYYMLGEDVEFLYKGEKNN